MQRTDKRDGYRGYMGSRPSDDFNFPQRVQNLIIRDYCARNGLTYKLTVTEYAMPGCYMMLADALGELPQLEGIVACSLSLLPKRKAHRLAVYDQVLSSGAELHAALENLVLRERRDIGRFEDVLDVALALKAAPLGGRCDKSDVGTHSFWRAFDAVH